MAHPKFKNYRWFILLLLFIATTINYLDRQIIGLLKPLLEKEFSWSETDFAYIVMAFTAAYAIGLLASGKIIDKVGTKLGYSISIVIWSTAGMLHAVSKNVWGFVAARIGLGIGEAGNFPAGVKAIAEWFPKKERGLATGIFNSGTSIGVVIALFIVPYILTAYGWKAVFWLTGLLGFIWLALWLIFYEIPARQKRLSAKELALIQGDQADCNPISNDRPIPWLKLFSMPQTWAVITGKFLIDPIFWFFLFWLPSYFSTTFNFDLSKPSPELMIIYASTTLGSIGGGYFSSLLIKNGWRTVNARKMAMLVFAVLEISIIFTQFVSTAWIAVLLLSVSVALHQAWATNVFTLASDMFPASTVSSVVGISGAAGAVGGMLFPLLVGYLLDKYKLEGNIDGGYNLIFTICGFTYLLAWTIIHLLTKRKKLVPTGKM